MYNIASNDNRSFWSFLCVTLNCFVTSTRHFVVGGGILHEFCLEISIIYSSLHLCLSATMDCLIASFCILIPFITKFIKIPFRQHLSAGNICLSSYSLINSCHYQTKIHLSVSNFHLGMKLVAVLFSENKND